MHGKLLVGVMVVGLLVFVSLCDGSTMGAVGGGGRAVVNRDAVRQAGVVAPFLDSQTFSVVRLDVTKIDVDAVLDKVVAIMSGFLDERDKENMKKEIGEFRVRAKDRVGGFVSAGGRDAYGVFSLVDFPRFFVVVPTYGGLDKVSVRSFVELIASDFSIGAVEVVEAKGAFLVAHKVTTDRLGAMARPVHRAELVDALSVAADRSLQVAVIPSVDQRRVIEEMMPMIPALSGQTAGGEGARSTIITEGLQWAVLGFDGPPAMSLDITVQSKDNAAAENLKAMIDVLYAMFAGQAEVREFCPKIDPILESLAPVVVGDRVRLSVDSKQADSLIDEILTPALGQARKQAQRIVSMQNIHGFLTACFLYANDHGDHWPDDLSVLVRDYDMPVGGLTNPREPHREIGYVYVKPGVAPEKIKNVQKVVVIYEAYDVWPEGGVNVGFAEGHVEFINDEERFKSLLGSGG